MAKRALIVYGGWDGHQPVEVSQLFDAILTDAGFETTLFDDLGVFVNSDLDKYDLIVPHWTMGSITHEQCQAVCVAVAEEGVGLAGCHGGMGDSFRENTEWQFMVGGQFVAHPGNDGTPYTVHIQGKAHQVTRDLDDFEVASEQYYMHVDPGVHVLADCVFPNPAASGPHTANPCRMPTIWTKSFGKGRIFYNALGHHHEVLEIPVVREIMRRGFLWATR
jgi:type 1 glutamine amidotransferase